jgi:protein TonB
MIAALLLAIATSTVAPPPCPPDPIGRVGCCREAPRLLSRYDEPYLAVAKRKHLRGMAIIELIIEPHGTVCAAQMLKGLDPDFDRAAVAAVKQWRFRPALNHNGKPITVLFNVTVKTRSRN